MRRALIHCFSGTGGGLCAKKCPVRNIKLKGKRVWFAWQCEGCMHCINVCPEHTIRFSVFQLAALVFATVWNPLIAFGLYKAGFLAGVIGGFGAFIVDLLITLACTFALFSILDWLLFALGFVPGMRRAFMGAHGAVWAISWGEIQDSIELIPNVHFAVYFRKTAPHPPLTRGDALYRGQGGFPIEAA